MSISEIAIKYNRSRKTISGQKQSALRKLGLKNDVELFKHQGDIGG
jgi:DNA-binding CsgD family transcriptional regulator